MKNRVAITRDYFFEYFRWHILPSTAIVPDYRASQFTMERHAVRGSVNPRHASLLTLSLNIIWWDDMKDICKSFRCLSDSEDFWREPIVIEMEHSSDVTKFLFYFVD